MTEVIDTPATISELKAACPKASSDFLVAQLEKSVTVAQAVQAYNEELAAENERLKNQPTEGPGYGRKGNQTLADVGQRTTFGPGGAIAEWNEELAALMKGGMARMTAVATLAKRRPDLREAVVAEANADR